eukprot:scaffold26655_cov15-Tisochrysis_lutea.AAC.2
MGLFVCRHGRVEQHPAHRQRLVVRSSAVRCDCGCLLALCFDRGGAGMVWWLPADTMEGLWWLPTGTKKGLWWLLTGTMKGLWWLLTGTMKGLWWYRFGMVAQV